MEASIDCDWLPSASTLTPKTNGLLLKGDWFSPIATKEIDFSDIAWGLLMILILTVTGPEKRLPIIANVCACTRMRVCVCGWTQTGFYPQCVWVSIKSIPRLFFPLHSAKVPIDPLQQMDHHFKQMGTEEKTKQSLFTSAKISLWRFVGQTWIYVNAALWLYTNIELN